MNGIDVRALGWVATRDICAEMARTAIGGRARISPAMLRELGDRWRAVQTSLQADRSWRLNMSVIVPLATPLSKASETAIAEFVEQLAIRFPDRYRELALQRRWLNGCATFIASAAASAVLASIASSDIPIIGDAALVLLVMACWSFITTIQLWRTHRLVEWMRQHHTQPPRTPVTR